MEKKQDILFLSGIGWNFSWQRHQQFATLFARDYRVLFVEMALSPANLLTEGRGTFSHWASWRKGVREIADDIHLYTCPPVLPFGRSSRVVNRLNQGLVFRGVRRAMGSMGMNEPIVWVSDPYFSVFSRDFGQKLTIFDWIHGPARTGLSRKGIVYDSLTEEIVKGADLIITPSRLVYEKYGAGDGRFHFVPNGVDMALYSVPVPTHPPPELASLQPPLIGFSGTVGPAVDTGLLEFLAGKRKDWSFVFVGLVRRDVSALKRYPNVLFLGQKKPEELPWYLSSLSAGIIPYVVSGDTETVHPVKTYEYLAAGLPVVSTALPELEHLGGVIERAGDKEDFLHRLERVIERDDEAGKEKRRRLAAEEHSWDGRMRTIEETAAAALRGR